MLYRLGQAVAALRRPASVVVGHDMPAESTALAAALAQGLLDCGVDVLPLGLCGTEEVYFHTAREEADAGLMVTVSHNPEDYSGFKMVLRGAAAATRENALNAIKAAGGNPVPCRTGHAFFKDEMRRRDAIYGGEMSAHHYFRDFSYCDSSMLTWLSVVARLSEEGFRFLFLRMSSSRNRCPLSGDML